MAMYPGRALIMAIVVSEWIMFGFGCMCMLLGICCMNQSKKCSRKEFEGSASGVVYLLQLARQRVIKEHVDMMSLHGGFHQDGSNCK
eukprot:15366967-Ditylum_brightwellii.AAC.1